jgi:hypothetical protein
MEIKLILAVTKKYYLPATYRILGNIMCWGSTPYIDIITGNHQYRFEQNQ